MKNQSFLYQKVSWSLIMAVISFFMISGASGQVVSNCSYEEGSPYLLSINDVKDKYCVAIVTCNVNGETRSGNKAVCKVSGSNKSMVPCPTALACAQSKDPTIFLTGPTGNSTSNTPASSVQYEYRGPVTNVHIAGNNFCMGDGVSKQTGKRKLIFCRDTGRSRGMCSSTITPDICANPNPNSFGFGFTINSTLRPPTRTAEGNNSGATRSNSSVEVEGMPWLNEEDSSTPPKRNPRDGIHVRSRIRIH